MGLWHSPSIPSKLSLTSLKMQSKLKWTMVLQTREKESANSKPFWQPKRCNPFFWTFLHIYSTPFYFIDSFSYEMMTNQQDGLPLSPSGLRPITVHTKSINFLGVIVPSNMSISRWHIWYWQIPAIYCMPERSVGHQQLWVWPVCAFM